MQKGIEFASRSAIGVKWLCQSSNQHQHGETVDLPFLLFLAVFEGSKSLNEQTVSNEGSYKSCVRCLTQSPCGNTVYIEFHLLDYGSTSKSAYLVT